MGSDNITTKNKTVLGVAMESERRKAHKAHLIKGTFWVSWFHHEIDGAWKNKSVSRKLVGVILNCQRQEKNQ